MSQRSLFLIRRFPLCHSVCYRNEMKIHSAAVKLAASLALASWTPTDAWVPALSQFSQQRLSYSTSPTLMSASTLTTAAEEAAEEAATSPAPTKDVEQPIAEGKVVSFYRGGLAAVQIQDDVQITNSKPGDAISSQAADQGDDLLGHQAIFPDGTAGVIAAYRPPIAFVYALPSESGEDTMTILDGTVKVLDSVASVSMSEDTHIVDCFGRSLVEDLTVSMDHGDQMEREILASIPQVKDIALINSPMLTGTTMIDTLAPIGKGQNMLVIGHNLPLMRGFAQDFLSTQIREGSTKCVYAVTKDRELVIEQLREANLLDDVIVVSSRPGLDDADEATKAAEATLVAATACSIAEAYALNKGKDALVIVDTIDQHQSLWRATTQTLVDVYGAESVVKADREGGASSEMRAFYSSLIQRSGQFNKKKGGGSVTMTLLTCIPEEQDDANTVYAESDFEGYGDKLRTRLNLLIQKKIPLTAENLRKIQIPIPSATEGKRRMALQHVEDLISMSDGQIWFDERLEEAGQSPPMDSQRSVTRIGIGADTVSRADAPAVRRVAAEGVRLEIAQAASMDGAEATEASRKQIRKRNAWLLAMHQEPGHAGRSLSESCVALLAASSGALDKTIDSGALAGTEEGKITMEKLLEHVKEAVPEAMKEIDESLDIKESTRGEVESAIKTFLS